MYHTNLLPGVHVTKWEGRFDQWMGRFRSAFGELAHSPSMQSHGNYQVVLGTMKEVRRGDEEEEEK